MSGAECILLCMLEDECCQSVNYRKSCAGQKNCELLRTLASEKPEVLEKDVNFDHYVLLQPKRVSDCNVCYQPFFKFDIVNKMVALQVPNLYS